MRRVAISALVLCGLASSARGADKSGVSPDRLRLPKGPGSLEGTGENVQPNLSMGTMSYRVAVDVPEGYPGLTPDLSLVYDSGAGNSPLGIGWSLPLPAIERMTSRGVPRYSPDDVFAAGGSDELVRVSSSGEYRARFEKSFVRYTWQDADGDGTEGYWTAEYPDGRVGYFGADSRGRLVRNARVDGAGGVFRYHLVSMLDALGHELRYGYEKDGGSSRLASVEYVFVDDVPRYEVTLGYEPRADPTSDAKPGVELRTTERLSHIDVMARGSMIRSYELCYDDDCGLVDPDASGVSRLARVRWFGRDGAGPHPIRFSFEYSADLGSSTPSIVEMQGALGVDFRAGTADLVDLDSDGLPDVVDTAGSRHRIFLNELGEGFAEPVTSTTGSLKLGAPGTDMLDLDGDGRTDMVDAEGGFVLWNRGSGDWALEEQPRGFDMPSPGDDANLRFLDYDGDKRIDLVHADRTATWIHENRGSGSFILVEQGLASIGASFVEDALQFADMNGDGLLDAVRKTLGLLAYRMNLGLGRFGDWIEMTNLPSDFAGDEQLVDLNGDALADVVAARGDAVLYAVNRDGTRLADQVVLSRTDELAIPEGSAELSLRFADMNGSGSTDVVWIDPSGAVTYLELFPERPNLLARIDNGIGKTIEIDYGSSVEHLARDGGSGAWQYRLPQALLTVDELAVRDELSGVEQRQVFHYRNGYYDGVERQFRGFTDVVVDTPGDDGVETGRVSHHFDVGADDVYRKGLMLEQRTESAGELLATSEQRYGDCAPSGVPTTTPRVRFLCPVETIRTVTERRPEGEWVTVRENYEYDGYGNRTLLAKLGVTAIGGGACEPCTRAEGAFGAPCGDACSGDESYERTRFVSPGDADGRWILNRPWRKRVSGVDDGDGYSEELTYYDGEPFVGLPAGTLSYGLISRVNLRVSGDERIDGKRFRYDTSTGAVLEQLDAADRRRVFTYDPAGLLVESETVVFDDPARDEPYALTMTAAYDPLFDTVSEASSFLRVVGDEVLSEPRTTAFAWDDFGRLSAVAKPGDDLDSPTETYEYELVAPVSRVVHRTRTDASSVPELADIQCFDGIGRKLQTRTLLDSNRYQVSGFFEFNAAGKTFRTYQPSISASATCDLSGSTLYVETRLDATGRVLRTVEPDDAIGYPTGSGTPSTTRNEYLPLRTLTYDAEDTDPNGAHYDTPLSTSADGLGRTIRRERSIREEGANGKPTLRFVPTELTYDELGRLRGYVQRQGSTEIEKVQTYDLLGRVLTIADPDSGTSTFGYDRAGNVISAEDARGVVTRSAYDEANRLIEMWEDGRRDETSIAYAYDAAPDCERCTNAEGQLARVSYPTSPDGAERGEDVVGYDARGQAIYSRRSMDGHVFEFEKELDNAGRIVGRSYPTGHFVEFELDGAGRLLGVPGHIERVNYEDRGPVRRVTLANGVVSDYRYDALSRLTALQTTGRRENVQDYAVARDRVGNVVAVVDETDAGDAPSLDAEHDYDDWYRLLESRLDIDLPAEETLEFRYDDLDNVVSKTSNLDDSPDHVGDYVYGEDGAGPHAVTTAGELGLGYDSAGNLKSRGDDEYAWDFLGRLTEVRRGDGSLGAFVYGPARDRIKKDEDGHFTYYVAPDFEVRDGSGIVYVSLGDQKVVKIEAPEYATTMFADLAPGDATGDVYTPDPDGAIDAGDAWVAQAVLSGTFAADDLPAVTDALVDELLAATTRRLLGVQTETITYLHHDQLGSTVATTDADGNVIERSLQYPFGLPRFESGGLPEDYGHSGKERDASGLTSFGARYQDPWLARWVSVDPLFASLDAKAAGSPEATVAYAFAQNAPISLKDPLGLDAYLIAGGPSIGDPDHDKSGWNFVSAAALRVKNLKDTGYKEPVHVIVYAPNYEKRAKAEGKPEAYYLDRVKNYSAAKYGYDVTFIRSHDELTTMLKGTKPGQIDRLEYFGHSAGRDMLLEYGGTTVGSSGDNWGIADAKKIDANRFEKGAEFISWGCFQGEPGGLVQELTKHFGIRGVGAEGKTDFQPIGQGIWKPSGTYKTYESGKLQP